MATIDESGSGASHRPPNPVALRLRQRCARCGHPRSFHNPVCRAIGSCWAEERCPEWLEALPPGFAVRQTSSLRMASSIAQTPHVSTSLHWLPRGLAAEWAHVVEPHDPSMFGEGSHGRAGWCSYVRYCGRRAAVDSFDRQGRRRALCEWHLGNSAVYGSDHECGGAPGEEVDR